MTSANAYAQGPPAAASPGRPGQQQYQQHVTSSGNKNADFKEGKIFLGGLNFSTTADTLQQFCSKWYVRRIGNRGAVSDVCVIEGKGYGFVTFADFSAAFAFLEPGKHNIDGREVEVKAARPRVQGAMRTSRKIFVGGLPRTIKTEEFKQHFEAYGKLEDCAVVTDASGNSRGFGFATYESLPDTEKALIVRHLFAGHEVDCKRAVPKDEAGVAAGAAAGGRAPRAGYAPDGRYVGFGQQPGQAGAYGAGYTGGQAYGVGYGGAGYGGYNAGGAYGGYGGGVGAAQGANGQYGGAAPDASGYGGAGGYGGYNAAPPANSGYGAPYGGAPAYGATPNAAPGVADPTAGSYGGPPHAAAGPGAGSGGYTQGGYGGAPPAQAGGAPPGYGADPQTGYGQGGYGGVPPPAAAGGGGYGGGQPDGYAGAPLMQQPPQQQQQQPPPAGAGVPPVGGYGYPQQGGGGYQGNYGSVPPDPNAAGGYGGYGGPPPNAGQYGAPPPDASGYGATGPGAGQPAPGGGPPRGQAGYSSGTPAQYGQGGTPGGGAYGPPPGQNSAPSGYGPTPGSAPSGYVRESVPNNGYSALPQGAYGDANPSGAGPHGAHIPTAPPGPNAGDGPGPIGGSGPGYGAPPQISPAKSPAATGGAPPPGGPGGYGAGGPPPGGAPSQGAGGYAGGGPGGYGGAPQTGGPPAGAYGGAGGKAGAPGGLGASMPTRYTPY